MYIGICKITLRIPENQNLKGKRQIIKSLCDSIRSRFSVSIAEINHHDQWQLAQLGIAQVGVDSKVLNATLSKIIDFIVNRTGDFELLNHEIDVMAEI